MSAARSTAAKSSRTNRSRVTNSPQYVAGADNRSPWARRRRDLVEDFIAALGGERAVTPMQLMHVRRAAELTALAEETRAKALCEGTGAVDLAALVRLEGAASRAVRALGIKPSARKPPTITEWMAAQAPRPAEAAE